MVRLYGRVLILVCPSRTILGSDGIGNCVKDGSPIVSVPLVSASSSLISDSGTDVDDFL